MNRKNKQGPGSWRMTTVSMNNLKAKQGGGWYTKPRRLISHSGQVHEVAGEPE